MFIGSTDIIPIIKEDYLGSKWKPTLWDALNSGLPAKELAIIITAGFWNNALRDNEELKERLKTNITEQKLSPDNEFPLALRTTARVVLSTCLPEDIDKADKDSSIHIWFTSIHQAIFGDDHLDTKKTIWLLSDSVSLLNDMAGGKSSEEAYKLQKAQELGAESSEQAASEVNLWLHEQLSGLNQRLLKGFTERLKNIHDEVNKQNEKYDPSDVALAEWTIFLEQLEKYNKHALVRSRDCKEPFYQLLRSEIEIESDFHALFDELVDNWSEEMRKALVFDAYHLLTKVLVNMGKEDKAAAAAHAEPWLFKALLDE